MQLCDSCNENESTIHITHVDDTEVMVRHLCEECAIEEGIQLPFMGDEDGEETIDNITINNETEPDIVTCSRCGTTEEEFNKTHKAGCSRCYEIFEHQLEDSRRSISGPYFYKGKQYYRAGSKAFKSELSCLKEELSIAVNEQKFEVASVLRDRIKVLENQVLNK